MIKNKRCFECLQNLLFHTLEQKKFVNLLKSIFGPNTMEFSENNEKLISNNDGWMINIK